MPGAAASRSFTSKPAAKGGVRKGGAGGIGGIGADYAYVEVMACPGGCTNGGGQIRWEDLPGQHPLKCAETAMDVGIGKGQKEWARRVDEAYFSMSEDSDSGPEPELGEDVEMEVEMGMGVGLVGDEINGISPARIRAFLTYWAQSTGLDIADLVRTGFEAVVSDVGKVNAERGVEVVAGKEGGGW